MLKLSRRYLNWIQNSVFEGELSDLQLKEYILEAKKIMNTSEDSLIIFSSRNSRWLDKKIIGVEPNALDNIL